MRLPNFRRIFKADYEVEMQAFVEQLAQTLNSSFEVLYDLANKKISIRDNVLCSVRDVDVIVDATGRPTTTTSMGLDGSGKVEGLLVIRAENITSATTYPEGCPFITFTPQENSVLFNNITGLQANYKYRLRVIAFQG